MGRRRRRGQVEVRCGYPAVLRVWFLQRRVYDALPGGAANRQQQGNVGVGEVEGAQDAVDRNTGDDGRKRQAGAGASEARWGMDG